MEQNELQKLIEQIKLEDATEYLSLINKANEDKLETREVVKILKKYTSKEIKKFSPGQLKLLYGMCFKGGHHLYMNSWRETPSPFELAFKTINTRMWIGSKIDPILKEDLIYFTDYQKAQWRKANPSTRTKKGTELTFKMDMFSLQLFKNAIKKGFLRTEAKNYIMKVNIAFKSVEQTPVTIKVRNKFYAIILDNTEVHTKALINEIMSTELKLTATEYYIPAEDEVLAVRLPYMGSNEVSYATSDSMNTYSTDLTLVTHNIGMELVRDNNRLLSASSMLLTAHAATNCEAYKTLSARMLRHVPTDMAKEALAKTQAVATLRTILKENHE